MNDNILRINTRITGKRDKARSRSVGRSVFGIVVLSGGGKAIPYRHQKTGGNGNCESLRRPARVDVNKQKIQKTEGDVHDENVQRAGEDSTRKQICDHHRRWVAGSADRVRRLAELDGWQNETAGRMGRLAEWDR